MLQIEFCIQSVPMSIVSMQVNGNTRVLQPYILYNSELLKIFKIM